MDFVTHPLLGATLAAAGGFDRRLGEKAAVFGLLAAAAPDLDTLAIVGGEWRMLVFHRGATHSCLILALATPLAGWLGGRLWGGGRKDGPPGATGATGAEAVPGAAAAAGARRGAYLAWTLLAGLALFTHPLLDLFTSYGTQLFWPLSRHRFALDGIAVIDPAYTLPLLAAVLVAVSRRFSPRAKRRTAQVVLVLTSAYLLLGYGLSRHAIARGREELARAGFAAAEIRAVPTMLNVVLWRVVARDAAGNLRVGMLSLCADRPIAFRQLDRPDDPLVARALESPRGRIFEWFALGMVSARVTRDPAGARVALQDQRYGLLTDPGWSPFAAETEFDGAGRLVAVRSIIERRGLYVWREAAAMWRAIRGEKQALPPGPPGTAPPPASPAAAAPARSR